MKKILFAAALAGVLCSCGSKGYTSYSWEYHELDAAYDRGTNEAVQQAISAYDSLMAPLQEIVCYSKDVYSKGFPESGLSNFAVDALRDYACKYSGSQIDIGLLNFGGIRTDLPKGAVRVYDIVSIFPINNYLTRSAVYAFQKAVDNSLVVTLAEAFDNAGFSLSRHRRKRPLICVCRIF